MAHVCPSPADTAATEVFLDSEEGIDVDASGYPQQVKPPIGEDEEVGLVMAHTCD